MANMSYCRFQNTLHDFNDCTNAIENGEAQDSELSREEIRARDALIAAARELIAKFDEDDTIDFTADAVERECGECGEPAAKEDELCAACRAEFNAMIRAASAKKDA